MQKLNDEFLSIGIKAKGILYNFSNWETDLPVLIKKVGDDLKAVILNAATRNKRLMKIHEKPDHHIKGDLQDNIFGNLFLLKNLIPVFQKNSFGRIVFISSISVDQGTSLYATYAMYKSALEQLIKNIAVDYGHENILANTVRLGLFKTSRTKMFWKRPEYIKAMSEIIPMGKLGEIDQVANPIASLLEENQYINGTTIEISGGMPKQKVKSFLDK